jgi:hypothetical protein
MHEPLVFSDDEKEDKNKENFANLTKQYNSHQVKATNENFFDLESQNETIRNTFFNKFLGKINKEK